jgi:hypothetical protein
MLCAWCFPVGNAANRGRKAAALGAASHADGVQVRDRLIQQRLDNPTDTPDILG